MSIQNLVEKTLNITQ